MLVFCKPTEWLTEKPEVQKGPEKPGLLIMCRIIHCAAVLIMGLIINLPCRGQVISSKLDSVLPSASQFFQGGRAISFPAKKPGPVTRPADNLRTTAGLPTYPVAQCMTYTFRL